MIPHVLSKNKTGEMPDRMIFFDSESFVDSKITDEEYKSALTNSGPVKKEHDLYLICATFIRRTRSKVDPEILKEYHGDDIRRHFWEDADAYNPGKTKTWMFAHNAKYDVLITGAVTELARLGYRVESFNDSTPFFLKMRNDGKKSTILIISSTNYYRESLKELARHFDMEKGEVEDYKTISLEDSIIYCKQDVNILKTAILKFMAFIQINDLGSFAMTNAGQAFSAFRHRFLKENQIFIHRNIPALILERNAYAGGRNEALKIGRLVGDVYYLDINSMYPFLMKTQKYPIKLVSYRTNVSIEDMKTYLGFGYGAVAKVEVICDETVYFKKDKRLLFPYGYFETYMSTPEIEYALAKGHITKIISASFYEMDHIFEGYVDFFYGERMKAQADNNATDDHLYKIFLNSLYGKFGQKNITWELVADADTELIDMETVYNMDTKRFESYKTFGGSVFKHEILPDGENESYNSFPAIAGHVTAYARMFLWEYIQTAGIENVFYMDTDSLFVSIAGYDNLKKAGRIHPKKLGYMKLEKISNNVIINGCKDYIFGDDIKLKGISLAQIKSGSTRKISETEYMTTVWRGFSTGLKNHDLSSYHNELMIKRLTRKYEKGEIMADGAVVPFMFDYNSNTYIPELTEKQISKAHRATEKGYNKWRDDPIMGLIKAHNGLRPESNGAYAEELSEFNYPIRNFTSGYNITDFMLSMDIDLNIQWTQNELLTYLQKYKGI